MSMTYSFLHCLKKKTFNRCALAWRLHGPKKIHGEHPALTVSAHAHMEGSRVVQYFCTTLRVSVNKDLHSISCTVRVAGVTPLCNLRPLEDLRLAIAKGEHPALQEWFGRLPVPYRTARSTHILARLAVPLLDLGTTVQPCSRKRRAALDRDMHSMRAIRFRSVSRKCTRGLVNRAPRAAKGQPRGHPTAAGTRALPWHWHSNKKNSIQTQTCAHKGTSRTQSQ